MYEDLWAHAGIPIPQEMLPPLDHAKLEYDLTENESMDDLMSRTISPDLLVATGLSYLVKDRTELGYSPDTIRDDAVNKPQIRWPNKPRGRSDTHTPNNVLQTALASLDPTQPGALERANEIRAELLRRQQIIADARKEEEEAIEKAKKQGHDYSGDIDLDDPVLYELDLPVPQEHPPRQPVNPMDQPLEDEVDYFANLPRPVELKQGDVLLTATGPEVAPHTDTPGAVPLARGVQDLGGGGAPQPHRGPLDIRGNPPPPAHMMRRLTEQEMLELMELRRWTEEERAEVDRTLDEALGRPSAQ